MVRIFWEKDTRNQRIDYFYDFSSNRIYRCCLAAYESESKIRLTFGGLLFVCGPLVTMSGMLFDDMTFTLSLVIAAISVLIISLGLILTNKSFNTSEEKKYLYVRNNGEIQNMMLSKELYKKGLKIRAGAWLFIIAGLFIFVQSINMYQEEGNVTSIILFYVSIFGTFIWIKFLSPLKYRRLKKLIRQNRKLVRKEWTR